MICAASEWSISIYIRQAQQAQQQAERLEQLLADEAGPEAAPEEAEACVLV